MKLPSPFNEIPFQRLGYNYASPVHSLPNLTSALNSTNSPEIRLFAKREDQGGSLACYGNKYRKFEYIIPHITSYRNSADNKVTTLVTEGGIQSNHTVQVAALARLLKLECLVLLHKGIGGYRAAKDKNAYLRTGNVQSNILLGASVRITDEADTGDEKGPLLPVLEELISDDKVPYWISSGASLHPLGGLGYARCAFEIAEQEESMFRSGHFDYIFVACGSGSTLAGLIAGFKLLDKSSYPPLRHPSRQIIGVMTSPTKSISYQRDRILRIARTAAAKIGLDPEKDLQLDDVRLDDRFVGTAYGILDKATNEIIHHLAQVEALMLDPVYTAKVMRGMIAWVQSGELAQDHAKRTMLPDSSPSINALFIHTGGQNTLSAYADVFQESDAG